METQNIIENQTIMMTDEEKIILQRIIWTEQSRRFREKMGTQYYDYIKSYSTKWNAKEETKASRKIKNAEYYLKKKAEKTQNI